MKQYRDLMKLTWSYSRGASCCQAAQQARGPRCSHVFTHTHTHDRTERYRICWILRQFVPDPNRFALWWFMMFMYNGMANCCPIRSVCVPCLTFPWSDAMQAALAAGGSDARAAVHHEAMAEVGCHRSQLGTMDDNGRQWTIDSIDPLKFWPMAAGLVIPWTDAGMSMRLFRFSDMLCISRFGP